MSTTTRSLDRVGLLIDGRPYTAEPANGDTRLYEVGGRQAVTSTGPNTLISLVTTPVDCELADIAAAQRRVRAAAVAPWTPRAQRPSARQAAVRLAARQYHAAVWAAGYAQAQADDARRPVIEKLTPKDTPALIELIMGKVLASPELRSEFIAACQAAEFEEMLTS